MGEEGLIKSLIALVKCGTCGQHYKVNNVSIIGHNRDLWYLKVLCSVCHTQSLVAIVISEDGFLESVTDLTDAEMEKFRGAGALIADDMLDMHNYLKEFSGDVTQLLNQE